MFNSSSLSPSVNFQINEHNQSSESPFRNESPFEGPFREELIEEIYKGRRLLVYYEYILLTTFLLVVIFHWGNKYWWNLKKDRSGSKEMDDVEAEVDERHYLLGGDHGRPRRSSTVPPKSSFVRIYSKITSYLMFQPQGKGVENIGVTFVVVIYKITTIIFAFWQVKYWITLAFRLGLLCTINIPLMYILGAKHSPLSFLTGWSYEQVNVFHRECGAICFFSIVIHLIIFACYFRIDYLFTHLWSIAGIIAGIAFVGIGITSALRIREKFYEFFYIVHIVGFLVSIPAVYLHYPTARPYAVAAGISVLYDRITRFLVDYRVMKCYLRSAPGDTVLMDIPFSPKGEHRFSGFFGRPFGWKTGQHIYITVIGCGTFESHPYTIASTMKCSDSLRLIIRAREGFSRRLLEAVEGKTSDVLSHVSSDGSFVSKWCILHGPYGVRPPEMPDSSKLPAKNTKLILVAGGAGVAFTYPLFQEFHKVNEQRIDDRTTTCGKYDINFLWVLPHRSFSEWIHTRGNEEDVEANENTTAVDESKMDIWATREKGRPDIFQLIKDYIYKEDEESSPEDDCWIAACGPDPLLREVRNAVATLRNEGMTNVHYYAERFGW